MKHDVRNTFAASVRLALAARHRALLPSDRKHSSTASVPTRISARAARCPPARRRWPSKSASWREPEARVERPLKLVHEPPVPSTNPSAHPFAIAFSALAPWSSGRASYGVELEALEKSAPTDPRASSDFQDTRRGGYPRSAVMEAKTKSKRKRHPKQFELEAEARLETRGPALVWCLPV